MPPLPPVIIMTEKSIVFTLVSGLTYKLSVNRLNTRPSNFALPTSALHPQKNKNKDCMILIKKSALESIWIVAYQSLCLFL
jgi:hypothetical protein